MTSSRIPGIMGVGDRGPLTEWGRATGAIPDDGPDDEQTARMGRRFEAPIREETRYLHPEWIVLETLTIVHPSEDWAADSADSIIYRLPETPRDLAGTPPDMVHEIKARSYFRGWGADGTDDIPPDVLLQSLWHCFCWDVDVCVVSRCVGAVYAEYVVDRTRERGAVVYHEMVEYAREFHARYIATGVEPPARAPDLPALRHLYPRDECSGEVLPATDRIVRLARRRQAWFTIRKEAKAEYDIARGYVDECDVRLRQALGHALEIDGVVRRRNSAGGNWYPRVILEDRE